MTASLPIFGCSGSTAATTKELSVRKKRGRTMLTVELGRQISDSTNSNAKSHLWRWGSRAVSPESFAESFEQSSLGHFSDLLSA
jgi:hypothetical protein